MSTAALKAISQGDLIPELSFKAGSGENSICDIHRHTLNQRLLVISEAFHQSYDPARVIPDAFQRSSQKD